MKGFFNSMLDFLPLNPIVNLRDQMDNRILKYETMHVNMKMTIICEGRG